ncbi:MAG: phosphoribosylglycinamide formyltransferase, partial [Spirochaeta sp.]
MARCAVFASGNGSNFEVIQTAFSTHNQHELTCLVCDRTNARVITRALQGATPVIPMRYTRDAGGVLDRAAAEKRVVSLLHRLGVDCIVFAGFMRLITPVLLQAYPQRILNIHPSLLPHHPGAHGLEDSIASPDSKLGITIHLVDEGMDTGPIIAQQSFHRTPGATPEQEKAQIHALEHSIYPGVIFEF